MTDEELILHQQKVALDRVEFENIWKAEKSAITQAWRADANRIELVAWRFFLHGKGLKV